MYISICKQVPIEIILALRQRWSHSFETDLTDYTKKHFHYNDNYDGHDDDNDNNGDNNDDKNDNHDNDDNDDYIKNQIKTM